jgi:hypothetical protein
MYWQLCFQFIV